MGAPTLSPPAVDVTLALFGGTDTEISPSDLPEGLSPDNQDMSFFPGETVSRPGLAKLYNASFGAVSVVYQKTYVQPNGDPLTLILTSDGKLWVEDVGISPGTKTQIGSTTPGLYAQSVSAFGREYIAFSDLLHGQDIPLQYDGANLDRVTQDGPGAAPVASDETTVYNLKASPLGLNGFNNLAVVSGSETGSLVTLILTTVDPRVQLSFVSGDSWQIAGMAAGYNGTVALLSCVVSAVNQLTITYLAATSGLAPVGAGGTAAVPYYLVSTNPAGAFSPAVNSQVTIAGAGTAGYNGTWPVRFTQSGPTPFSIYIAAFGLINSGNGTVSVAGNISAGTHQFVEMFLTRQGTLTQPSPIGSWTALGGKRVVFTNLHIGPPNIVARVIGLTGTGGDNFFILPSQATLTQPSGPPIIIPALIVPDNTSSTYILDFSDNALFAGIAIDQVGNDLFDQRVLGPVLGFFAYASRLATWGDYVKIENLLNMGFDGGYLAGNPLAPPGWTVGCTLGAGAANGELVAATFGFAWVIWGGGAGQQGLISQGCYQNSIGVAQVQPNTMYDVRLKASALPSSVGNLIITISSASTGFSTSASIPLLAITSTPRFTSLFRIGQMPAVIPADMTLSVYGSQISGAHFVTADEMEIIPEIDPYNNTISRWSYGNNPEGFAQTTGNLGPTDDQSPIQNFSLQKDVGLLHTGEATHEFSDNNFEPGDGNNAWKVDSLTHSVGALSLRACDPGKFGTGDAAEDWDIIASKNGVYLHLGSNFYKVGQEMSRTVGTAPGAVAWDDINWAAQQTVWVKNVVNKRYALIGAPVNGATAPNVIFVLDYREMDTAAQIANAMPLHITLSGKMKSSDMARKWTRWNIKANGAEVLVRPGNQKELYLGGGSGSTPGTGTAYGNLYSLDPTKLTDDDYGAMAPYYTTYAFVDHDQEQQLQLGSDRKLTKHISAFITGVGLVTITPYVNSLWNPLPATTPRQLVSDSSASTTLSSDMEWVTTIRGERVFFKIQVFPLPGTTDVKMQLQKLILWMMKDPVLACRGSRV